MGVVELIRALARRYALMTASLLIAAPALAGGLDQQRGQDWRSLLLAGTAPHAGQESSAKPRPAASDDEIRAEKAVEAGTDASARLKAGADFVRLFPKSALMKQVALLVGQKIDAVTDGAQKVTFAEAYKTIFKDPELQDMIEPTLIDGFAAVNRVDDAFSHGLAYVQKHPDDSPMLVDLTVIGFNETKQGRHTYAKQAQDCGLKAIQLIEADKKPEEMAAPQWAAFKTRWLGQIYQCTGFFALVAGNEADGRERLSKATTLSPSDPLNYVLLGSVADTSYQKLGEQYKAMSPGPEQDAALKKALAQMDVVIDLFAHAVALSEGVPQYKQLHDQIAQTLAGYYKYRYKGTDGLQQLIDKYKKAPGTAQ